MKMNINEGLPQICFLQQAQAVMLEEVSMEKQKDQEFAHLEVKRLCGVFGAPLPPVEEKPVDKVKEPPRPYRSREREER